MAVAMTNTLNGWISSNANFGDDITLTARKQANGARYYVDLIHIWDDEGIEPDRVWARLFYHNGTTATQIGWNVKDWAYPDPVDYKLEINGTNIVVSHKGTTIMSTTHTALQTAGIWESSVAVLDWYPKASSITVTYNGNGSDGGSVPSQQTGTAPLTVAGAGTMTKTGYSFAGWNTLANGTGTAYSAGASINTAETLYAQWSALVKKALWNNNDGEGVAPLETNQTYDSPVVLPTTNPTRTGFVFAGWWDNATAGTQYTSATASVKNWDKVSDTTLYARWTPAEYQITYNLNGGSQTGAPVSYTYGTGTALPVPTKDGYNFVGWYESADFSTSKKVSLSETDYGDKALYAKWQIKAVKLSGSYTPAQFNDAVNGEGVESVELIGNVTVSGEAVINQFVDFTGNYTLTATMVKLMKWRDISILRIEATAGRVVGDSEGTISIPDGTSFSTLYPKPTIHNTILVGALTFGTYIRYPFSLQSPSIGARPNLAGMVWTGVTINGIISGTIDGVTIQNFTHNWLPTLSGGGIAFGYTPSQTGFHACYVTGSNNQILNGVLDYRTCIRNEQGNIIKGSQTEDGHDTCHGGLKLVDGHWGGSCKNNLIKGITSFYPAHEEAVGTEYYTPSFIGEILSVSGNTVTFTADTGYGFAYTVGAGGYLAMGSGLAYTNYYEILSTSHVRTQEDDGAIVTATLDTSKFSTADIAVGDFIRVSGGGAVENDFEDIILHNKWGTPSWGQGCNVGLGLFFNSFGNRIKNLSCYNDGTISPHSQAIGQGSHFTDGGPSGRIYQLSFRNEFDGIHAYGQEYIAHITTVIGDDLYWMEYPYTNAICGGGHVLKNITADNDAKFYLVNEKNITLRNVPQAVIETHYTLGLNALSYAEYPADKYDFHMMAESLWSKYYAGMNPHFPLRGKASSLEAEPDWKWLHNYPETDPPTNSITTFSAIYYEITLNRAGGTGTPDTVSFDGQARTLPVPSKSGANFIEWNTDPEGNGTGYNTNDYYSFTEDVTLYAIWELAGFSVWVGNRQVLEIYVDGKRVIGLVVDGKTVF